MNGVAERLEKAAETEDRIARSLKGCSFYGEPPWREHQRRATDLRLAAAIIRKQEGGE